MKQQYQKKAIYKIENKINHKIYIGQSIHPEQRFHEHCQKHEMYTSLINKAIQKYGIENFSFEILGWFEDYNEKEKYYIQKYRSYKPNGYNILMGGEEPPVRSHTFLSQEQVNEIKKDLKNFSIPLKQIVKKHKITYDMVRHIKNGTSWKDPNETYPLRPDERILDNKKAEKVIELLQTTNMSQKEIGAAVGWNRSAVTMINIGKNHFNPNLSYPIRK